MSLIFTGQGVNVFALLSLKSQLELEIKGIKPPNGRRTANARAKERFGFKGGRLAVHAQLCELIEQEKRKLKPGDIRRID